MRQENHWYRPLLSKSFLPLLLGIVIGATCYGIRDIVGLQYWTVIAGVVGFIVALWIVPKWQLQDDESQGIDRIKVENECRKTLAEIVGGVVLFIGLYFTAQQLTLSRISVETSEEAQATDRFARATDELGNNRLGVRLGGIYTMGLIAQNPKRDYHWIVSSVLAAFVRDKTVFENKSEYARVAEDVQAALTVIADRDPQYLANDKASGHFIDLHDRDLRGAFLVNGHLQDTDFSQSHLENADFEGPVSRERSSTGPISKALFSRRSICRGLYFEVPSFGTRVLQTRSYAVLILKGRI